MWIQERSSSRVFALGGVEKGRGGGRREGRNEVFPPFVRRASFGSGEKTLQALLSLSYESMPDITLFAEFLLLREVFYSYVISFIRTELD